MEHIRRKVDAKIEIFAFIGLRPRADEFTGTFDTLSAVGTCVIATAAVLSAILEIGANAVAAAGGTFAAARASTTFGSIVTTRAAVTLELGRIGADAVTSERGGFTAIPHIIVAVAVAVRTLAPAIGTIRIPAAHVPTRTAVLGIDLFIDACAVTDFHPGRTRIRLTLALCTRFVGFTDMAARTTVVMRRFVIDTCAAALVEPFGAEFILSAAATGRRTHAIVTRAVTAHISADDETGFTIQLDALDGIIRTTGSCKKNGCQGCNLYGIRSVRFHCVTPLI